MNPLTWLRGGRVLPVPITNWYCPACKATDQTQVAGPHTRFHTCPQTRFMSIAMVPAGISARIVATEREDYVGNDRVFVDPTGRPLMSISTERADGSNDLSVFAPTATGELRGFDASS